MKFKLYYNKNLKMSEGKLSAQCSHVAKELGRMTQSVPQEDVIIVLGLSYTKFKEKVDELIYSNNLVWFQVDNGLTEVPEGTMTVCGFVEQEYVDNN